MTRTGMLAAMTVVSLFSGCKGVKPVDWEAVDNECLRERVARPTAELDLPTLDAVLRDIPVKREFIRRYLDFLELVLDARTDGDTGGTDGVGDSEGMDTDGEGDGTDDGSRFVQGTQVFLEIACPGPGSTEFDQEFRFGHVRVDSKVLTGNIERALILDGNLRFKFVDCVGPEGFTAVGLAPAHYDFDTSVLGLEFDIEVAQPETGTTFPVDEAVITDFTNAQMLFELPTGTISVDLGLTGGTVVVSGRQADASCDVGVDTAVTCDWQELMVPRDPPSEDCLPGE